MPTGANSHFQEWMTKEKEAYVGDAAMSLAKKVAEWQRTRVDWTSYDP